MDHDDWLHGQCGGWESVVRHATDRFWKLPSFVEHVVNGRNVPILAISGHSVNRLATPKPADPLTVSSPVSSCSTDRFGKTQSGTDFGKTGPPGN
ncbi:hypothetical protein [uncultured Sphingomonas sp.]|uniref:hypothetical protein n=1 Tax=uncultured Sphingomonas sp. TaxID=158754 RepID=UPI0025F729AF|nr:hypothetical protein [uncultured Sphingomonas sp.]